ncbi:TRAP transporter small permease [Frigidibacter sp. MR17.14]|uniref:TRAP transporter small permease n=1 Tax=Frigidibacter sp. MR17.14 TaxID=3126509 RepID=UPI003012DA3A
MLGRTMTGGAGTATRSPILKAFCLGLTALRRLVDAVALLLLAYMACAILAQIVGRYFFNYSIAWSEETATFAQIWLTLLGAGIAMRHNQHVGVDVLVRKLPRPVQQACGFAGLALGAWFLATVVVGSLSMLAIGFMIKSPALRMPMAVPYMALPVGFGYFLLEFVIATIPRALRPETIGATPDETESAA